MVALGAWSYARIATRLNTKDRAWLMAFPNECNYAMADLVLE